jgi:hypothetical protein
MLTNPAEIHLFKGRSMPRFVPVALLIATLAGSATAQSNYSANGDGVGGLTANDFQCFLDRFAAGEAYANCDGSSGTPALTANDFQCFLNRFAEGCP